MHGDTSPPRPAGATGAAIDATPEPLRAYETAFTGWMAGDSEWGDQPHRARDRGVGPGPQPAGVPESDWAADVGERQLVELDTHYKPTRPGPHPVRLTRKDAAELATAVLCALEDTFHAGRVGHLRGSEAAELLDALSETAFALEELRDHAIGDLLAATGLRLGAPPAATTAGHD